MVVNEEFHDDPLTALVAPPRPYAGNRDFFVFVDAGKEGLKRHAVTGFYEEALGSFFETPARSPAGGRRPWPPSGSSYQPKTIALSIGGSRGVTRSLTRSSYDFLAEAMGPEAQGPLRVAPSRSSTSTPTPAFRRRWRHYRQMVELTAELARRALSSEVIRPGKTTVGDVRRWLYDRAWDAGGEPLVPARPPGAAEGNGAGDLAGLPGHRRREGGDAARATWSTSTSASPSWG